MKSKENGLIGPGSNDYGRTEPYHSHKVIKNEKSGSQKVVNELTPELADKIWNNIQQSLHDKRVSKDVVLYHLKQLKARIGKIKKRIGYQNSNTQLAINDCLKEIDAKIQKINK